MKIKTYYTDYPFTALGDIADQDAPIREVRIISYDNNKYCWIEVCGTFQEIKAGYIYTNKRCKTITANELRQFQKKK